jgi:4-hydroxy-L-threonine phosphate dehydrogenase PdxA
VTRPTLAVTLGDPRGIGPEIVRAALATQEVADAAHCIVVGPTGAGIAVEDAIGEWHGRSGPSTPQHAATAGALAAKAIERAVELARLGAVQGIVTAPIDKSALAAAGTPTPATPRCSSASRVRPLR